MSEAARLVMFPGCRRIGAVECGWCLLVSEYLADMLDGFRDGWLTC